MLKKNIENYITQNNSPYDKTVNLPQTIDSQKITFRSDFEKPTLLFLLFGILFAILVFFLSKSDFEKDLKSRDCQLLSDYPEIVSKLLLLHSAGLTIQNAFTIILNDYRKKNHTFPEHYIYLEIERTLNKIKSGFPESGAYSELGKRCHIQIYIKLGTLLEQNLRKGSSDLQFALKQELKESFSLHQHQVLQSGEKAGTKMLLPMILILLVVMMIIIIPALMSMNRTL